MSLLTEDMNTKQLINYKMLANFSSKIATIEDRSDTVLQMARMRVTFTNGYGISIVQGTASYGSDDEFEIAPLNKNGELDGSIIGNTGDDVVGYLSVDDVLEFVNMVSKL